MRPPSLAAGLTTLLLMAPSARADEGVSALLQSKTQALLDAITSGNAALFIPGLPRFRRLFQQDAQGKISGFVERHEAWDLVWKCVP